MSFARRRLSIGVELCAPHPTSSSSCLICRLNGGCAIFDSVAAWVKLRVRAWPQRYLVSVLFSGLSIEENLALDPSLALEKVANFTSMLRAFDESNSAAQAHSRRRRQPNGAISKKGARRTPAKAPTSS